MKALSVIFWIAAAVFLAPFAWNLFTGLLKTLRKHWQVFALVVVAALLLAPGAETEVTRTGAYSDTCETVVTEYPGYTLTTYVPTYAPDHANGGVCRNLTEDAAAIVVFVDDYESSWTQREIDDYLSDMILPGLDFIVQKAASYGHYISFDSAYYGGIAYNGYVGDFDNGCCPDLTSQFAAALGTDSINTVLDANRDFFGEEQIAYIFVLDKPGRSYAYWYENEGDYVEYAVLFTSMNGYEMQPDVVVHETMHLFGAEDMYAEGSHRVNRAAMAKRLHPREIFLQGQWNLWDNQISDFTAHTVGWLCEMPEVYKTAEWWS